MKLPSNLTIKKVMKAVERDEYEGFCMNCGTKHTECEPDARDYKCKKCGQFKVYGASEILMEIVS